MEQIRSREAIRAEGKQAAREGRDLDDCPHAEGTDAHDEWKNGYEQVPA